MARRRRFDDRHDTYTLMRYDARKKSLIVAYLLWFFLGAFGLHRMYAGRVLSGLFMLFLTLVGTVTAVLLIGWIPLAIVGVWWVIDALLTYVIVENHNDALARRLAY